jgi:hypothetical protein
MFWWGGVVRCCRGVERREEQSGELYRRRSIVAANFGFAVHADQQTMTCRQRGFAVGAETIK